MRNVAWHARSSAAPTAEPSGAKRAAVRERERRRASSSAFTIVEFARTRRGSSGDLRLEGPSEESGRVFWNKSKYFIGNCIGETYEDCEIFFFFLDTLTRPILFPRDREQL